MMDGRVKTLHPKVHGGLLARRDSKKHMAEAEEHGIQMIDLVCVNLYEFEKTVAQPDVTFEDAIEHIDIGGPSMLRSAAKNNDSVTVVCDPADYDAILEEMHVHGGATTKNTRRRLAAKVYTRTAAYDTAISMWLNTYLELQDEAIDPDDPFDIPSVFGMQLTKVQDLRYGENPHQTAAVFRFGSDFEQLGSSPNPLVGAEQIQGKELSYNNFLAAVAGDVTTAYDRAFACDPKSAFGGIIAVNREVPLSLVEHFADVNKQFVEVLIAPSYTPEALERLSRRQNLRVLATGGAEGHAKLELRSVDGGMLVQCVDTVDEDPSEFTCPTSRKPTDQEMRDLLFAWNVVKTVKSNAILVAKDQAGIGMGPGQPNRVDSALLACERAEDACERMGVEPTGFVAASDAFFPFRDNVDVLAEHGVTAIIQPGGSVRDDESIKACDDHDIAMIFTGTRHFRH